MFLQAGFNGRHIATGILGWTRHVNGRTKFALAELTRFESGDYAWHGDGFLTWGEQCVIGTRREFDLPREAQYDLPQSDLDVHARYATQRVEFTIIGEPASKANSRKLVSMNRLSRATGRMVKMPALIKSEKARAYEQDALRQIPPKARVRLANPVSVTLKIFYATERPDLDESVILDVLQDRYHTIGEGEKTQRVLVQRGVYRNDRQVREKHVFHAIDRQNPRAEIAIEPIGPVQRDLAMDEAAVAEE